MTTRSQKRKAVAEIVSGGFETSVTEDSPPENLVASSSKSPRIQPENLDEIQTSLRKEIMSDLTKILAENQKEMLKLIAPLSKKRPIHLEDRDSASEPENISVARTSTPVKITTATNSKTTPVNSRNSLCSSYTCHRVTKICVNGLIFYRLSIPYVIGLIPCFADEFIKGSTYVTSGANSLGPGGGTRSGTPSRKLS